MAGPDSVECMLCSPALADAHFGRVRVWEDELWRLSVVPHGPVPGFAHLEPRRHVPYITDLDGPEAATLGPTIAAAARLLQAAASAEKMYVYAFGDRVAHLHFNLAPHLAGDALVGGPGLLTPGAADAAAQVHQAVLASLRDLLRLGLPGVAR